MNFEGDHRPGPPGVRERRSAGAAARERSAAAVILIPTVPPTQGTLFFRMRAAVHCADPRLSIWP